MMLRLGLQVDGAAETPGEENVLPRRWSERRARAWNSAPRGVRRLLGPMVEYTGPLRSSAPWGYWAGTGGFAACEVSSQHDELHM